MNTSGLRRTGDAEWTIEREGRMRVPGVIYGDETLIREMDEKVREQVSNVACLPGIVKASFAMPDAHWGYGFPIGGVAAFDPEDGGVVSAGGVGFDISCGVRTLNTGIQWGDIQHKASTLADTLFNTVPAGVGRTGAIRLNDSQMDDMLSGGAEWAVEQGYGYPEDLARIECGGRADGAYPGAVSSRAKERQREEMGTLGSGNHYLEIQVVDEVFDEEVAEGFGLRRGECVVSIHCGSRGLGHQIGTDYLKEMLKAAEKYGIPLAERELACAPILSPEGRAYISAMKCGINCALANRQIITSLARNAFLKVLKKGELTLLYDVSHNTCREESHSVDGVERKLFVHRKGATNALGPGHPDVAASLRKFGQPVLIGGTMGTASYILAGTRESLETAFGSSCHGAGRNMSRNQARKQWRGEEVMKELCDYGITVKSRSYRGLAEEAPKAYKDVNRVVESASRAGLSRKVARLLPVLCIKG
ncbi:MAG: RtcB family protein [Verrucomicrobia bacterium]|nr:RtcB family protein [Verrucomicrobiota bacterium]